MANYRAIAATSEALKGLIVDRYPRDEFNPGLEVSLYQTQDFDKPMTEGFSIYLFRVAINGSVRNLTFRRSPDGQRLRPSLPLDLQYMITPWSRDAGMQQRMLGWVMRLMEDIGVLSAGHLNHYLRETGTFGSNEALELVCDPLTLTDYLTLWDRLRPRMPVSATYTLRMLLIDSDVNVVDGPPVQTRQMNVGLVTP
jgi:Pvc16 N-terminal domain